MTPTYLLALILVIHILYFNKLIIKWNVFGVFFISTILFSTIGILLYPFFIPYIKHSFWAFNFNAINRDVIIKTQIIAVAGLLLVLYSYSFGLKMLKGRIPPINHLKFRERVTSNLSKTNYYFVLLFVGLFLVVFLFIKRQVLIVGITQGLIGRDPTALILSRRGITDNYFYSITVYNVLPFLSVVAYYIYLKKKNLANLSLFLIVFSVSFLLILLVFQKRPLMIFLLTFSLAAYLFKKKLVIKKKKRIRIKGSQKRKYFFYGIAIFSMLLLLFYSATTYKFNNLYQAVLKLSEIASLRVVGRLAIPPFYYVHYFPNIHEHYHFSNIGLFSKIFHTELYRDAPILFKHYSVGHRKGSLAISAIFDFYGAFGYYGVFFGSLFLGLFISAIDVFIDKLEKNGINLIFMVFSLVFAYYLSQASLPRALLGYGFVVFVFLWIFLQKGFKIKMR